MPGYVHVCAKCGQEMVVPERFLGRELRCTGCGSGFTSAIPAAEIVSPAPAVRRVSGWRRWLIPGSLAVALAVAVAGLSLWLGGSRSEEPARPQSLTLGDGNQPRHYAAFDQSTLIEVGRLLTLPEAQGGAQLRQLLDAYRVIEVPSGTRVEVLIGGAGDAPMRVRLLTGRWAEKEVWVQASWVR